MQLQLAQLRACCARVVCARRAEWFCPSSMVVNLCGVCSQGRVVLSLVYGRQPVWCVLAGPSGFVPRPWSSTCVVCARRAEWFCPSSMVVNLCGVCSQGRVVLSLVHGCQPVWCVLAGPSGFVPRPWSSTHRKRSWNSPKFATRPAWLPPMVGLLLLIFVVYVFSSAVHLRIENKTSMHNRHQFGVCLYCGRFRHFLV